MNNSYLTLISSNKAGCRLTSYPPSLFAVKHKTIVLSSCLPMKYHSDHPVLKAKNEVKMDKVDRVLNAFMDKKMCNLICTPSLSI